MAVRKKTKIMRRRYITLFSLLFCLLLTGIVSAKMSSNPVEKEDGVQIAGWSVDVTSSGSGNMTLDAGNGTENYSLTVENNSEVASSYSIKVSNIPSDVKIGLDITSDSDMVTPTGGEVTFTNTGGDLSYIAPDNTRAHTLSLAAESTAAITQIGVDMTIEIQFMQKEPQP